VVAVSKHIEPGLLRGPIEPSAPAKHGVVLGDIIVETVMRAAHGGACLARMADRLARGHGFLFVDRGNVRVTEDDEVGVVERVRVGVERELGRAVGVLCADVVDDAVDGECALEDGWATSRWIAAVVHGDAGPSALAGRPHTVRPPDAARVVFDECGLGVVIVDDFAAKDKDMFPDYGFYSIKDSAVAIRCWLVVFDVGSGVEEVVVGREMEVECI
jgi:hypothetical protein